LVDNELKKEIDYLLPQLSNVHDTPATSYHVYLDIYKNPQ